MESVETESSNRLCCQLGPVDYWLDNFNTFYVFLFYLFIFFTFRFIEI